jgi:hypothetical protein
MTHISHRFSSPIVLVVVIVMVLDSVCAEEPKFALVLSLTGLPRPGFRCPVSAGIENDNDDESESDPL